MTKTSKKALLIVLRNSLIQALQAVNAFISDVEKEDEEEKQLEFPLFI